MDLDTEICWGPPHAHPAETPQHMKITAPHRTRNAPPAAAGADDGAVCATPPKIADPDTGASRRPFGNDISASASGARSASREPSAGEVVTSEDAPYTPRVLRFESADGAESASVATPGGGTPLVVKDSEGPEVSAGIDDRNVLRTPPTPPSERGYDGYVVGIGCNDNDPVSSGDAFGDGGGGGASVGARLSSPLEHGTHDAIEIDVDPPPPPGEPGNEDPLPAKALPGRGVAGRVPSSSSSEGAGTACNHGHRRSSRCEDPGMKPAVLNNNGGPPRRTEVDDDPVHAGVAKGDGVNVTRCSSSSRSSSNGNGNGIKDASTITLATDRGASDETLTSDRHSEEHPRESRAMTGTQGGGGDRTTSSGNPSSTPEAPYESPERAEARKRREAALLDVAPYLQTASYIAVAVLGVALLTCTLTLFPDLDHRFFVNQIATLAIIAALQFLAGIAVEKYHVRVNYTRKFVHANYFCWPLIMNFFVMKFDSGIATALWNFWIVIFGMVFISEPFVERFWVFRVFYRAIDRPEDRPFTRVWFVTQSVTSLIVIGACSFWLRDAGRKNLVFIPILILAFGDGLAEPIGVRFGKHKYTTGSLCSTKRYTRSLEGSAVVFLATVAAVSGHFGKLSTDEYVFLVCTMPPLMTIAEAYAPHSWDNPILLLTGYVLIMLAHYAL